MIVIMIILMYVNKHIYYHTKSHPASQISVLVIFTHTLICCFLNTCDTCKHRNAWMPRQVNLCHVHVLIPSVSV